MKLSVVMMVFALAGCGRSPYALLTDGGCRFSDLAEGVNGYEEIKENARRCVLEKRIDKNEKKGNEP